MEKGIIRNLARLKVHHEERGTHLAVERREDGLTQEATICERVQNNGDGDLEKRLKKDKEKAIAVLKRVHPSRVCIFNYQIKRSALSIYLFAISYAVL